MKKIIITLTIILTLSLSTVTSFAYGLNTCPIWESTTVTVPTLIMTNKALHSNSICIATNNGSVTNFKLFSIPAGTVWTQVVVSGYTRLTTGTNSAFGMESEWWCTDVNVNNSTNVATTQTNNAHGSAGTSNYIINLYYNSGVMSGLSKVFASSTTSSDLVNVGEFNLYEPDMKTITIKDNNQISFYYTDTHFLTSIDTSDGSAIQMFYGSKESTNNRAEDILFDNLEIQQDGWAKRLDLSCFSHPRTLESNELLTYRLIHTSFSGADTAFATFIFDAKKVKYWVTSADTGIVKDVGGTITTTVPAITPNDDGGTGTIPLDSQTMGVDRANFGDGIAGDVSYYFAILFEFIKLPFTIILGFFTSVGEIVSMAMASIAGLIGIMQQTYGILPSSVAFLITFGLMISIMKLLFGR